MIQGVTVVFIVILIGYGFLSRSNLYRQRLLTESNYAVLYESAITGGMLFVSVWLVVNAIKNEYFGCTSVRTFGLPVCLADQRYPLPQLDVLFGSTMVAALLVLLGNIVFSREKLGARIARDSGLIGTVVLDALEGNHLLQVTTVRNKVYVGWILTGPGMSKRGNVEDIAIVPLFGGFRDQQSHNVVLNTDYSTDVNAYADGLKVSNDSASDQSVVSPEMSVIIPMGEIALLKRFQGKLLESPMKNGAKSSNLSSLDSSENQ